MQLKNIINKFDKSSIKAGDGKEVGIYSLYTCSPIVNKFLNDFICDDEAIVLSTGGSFSIHYVKGKFNYSTDCYVFNTDKFNLKYLYYYLLNKSDDINKMFRGAGLKHLNKNEFVSLNINDIDLKQQLLIVKQLDKLTELITIRKQEIDKCNNLIKSQFVEMFENKNYPRMTGKELFTFSSGKFLEESKRKNSGFPVYGGNGITWYTDQPLIDFDTIIFGRVGAYCGNVKKVNEPVWITDNAIYIKKFKTDAFNLNFLFNMLEFIDFSRFAQHSGQPKITQKPLEEYNYVIPPIEEQLKFSKIVEQIDKQKFVNANLLQLLGKNLKRCYNNIIDFR